MNEVYGIAGQALELLETMDEGLAYLHSRVAEGFMEESRYLLGDINDARQAVNQVLASLHSPEETSSAAQSASEEFSLCLTEVEKCFDQSEAEKARFELQSGAIPSFKRWKEILNAFLSPLADS